MNFAKVVQCRFTSLISCSIHGREVCRIDGGALGLSLNHMWDNRTNADFSLPLPLPWERGQCLAVSAILAQALTDPLSYVSLQVTKLMVSGGR